MINLLVGLVERRPNSTSAVFGVNDAARSFAGTATYASIDALTGKIPTVSDEIQSMVRAMLLPRIGYQHN